MTLASGVLLPILLAAGIAAGAETDVREDDPRIVASEGFLSGHPDMAGRVRGVKAYRAGQYKDAMRHFRDGARYADKPSQAMLAMMLWNGNGIRADRVQAYAWIDLAAERGYKSFVATREKFWAALDSDERLRATRASEKLHATFADQFAKPRLNYEMRRAKLNVTGSHLGAVGSLVVMVRGPSGDFRPVSGSLFYSSRYWEPEKYWSWQDQSWDFSRGGQVEVGPLQPAGEAQKKPR